MTTYTEAGVLVLADISGFTAFITTTELEHGPQIIAALLEEVIRELSPPLEIQEVEGDAVFALGPDGSLSPRANLLDVLDQAFVAFKTKQRELAMDESCGCGACSNIGRLDLKIVAHHGRFLRQEIGGRGQVAGADVILAHQLLKNRVGKRAYLLLTEAALRFVGGDADRPELAEHVERYEHLGAVRCFVKNLEPAALTPVAA